MTEAEYLVCTDYRPLLAVHGRVTSSRRWRLFALACCRHIWHLMPEQARQVVEVVERFVERQASDHEREAAQAMELEVHSDPALWVAYAVAEPTARIRTVARNDVPTRCLAAVSRAEGKEPRKAYLLVLAHLVREVFGNPWHQHPFDPAWRTWNDSTPLKLAQGAYDDRAWDRLPIVADALEDAGCSDSVLLEHLRGTGPHARGCWALERVLDRFA